MAGRVACIVIELLQAAYDSALVVFNRPINSPVRLFFFLILGRPPRSTLFPYTTLFRSNPSRPMRRFELRMDFREELGEKPVARHGIPDSRLPVLKYQERRDHAGECADDDDGARPATRSEEHTSELQSLRHLVCRLLLEK